MNTHTTTASDAQVYVGTYAKYNNGDLTGQWLDLADYPDRESFLLACRELHSDEADPELMFQDFSGFPRAFYGESEIKADLWDWLALHDDDRELLERYQDATGNDSATIEDARDAHSGTYDSGADAAQQMAEDCGDIPKDLPSWIVIDWEASWNCNLQHDFSTSEKDGKIWLFHV